MSSLVITQVRLPIIEPMSSLKSAKSSRKRSSSSSSSTSRRPSAALLFRKREFHEFRAELPMLFRLRRAESGFLLLALLKNLLSGPCWLFRLAGKVVKGFVGRTILLANPDLLHSSMAWYWASLWYIMFSTPQHMASLLNFSMSIWISCLVLMAMPEATMERRRILVMLAGWVTNKSP